MIKDTECQNHLRKKFSVGLVLLPLNWNIKIILLYVSYACKESKGPHFF